MTPAESRAPAPARRVFLVHGNLAAEVENKRYQLQRAFLPSGEEDGELVDIRPPGNQPFKLDRAIEPIIQEVGTTSLVPGMCRVVVVHDLQDFRTEVKGSRREARKGAKSKPDPVMRLEEYVRQVMLPDTENVLLFVFNEDDEKGRRVAPSSKLYQMVRSVGEVFAFSEKRIDWRFEDALLSGDLNGSVRLLREWLDRGSNANFRVVTTTNSFLQLLLQARLREESSREGRQTAALFPPDLRPSLSSIPDFKARRYRQLASSVPLDRIHKALVHLNEAQKAFFPTGEEAVVHDPNGTMEVLLSELFARPRA